ncbi:phosphohydrolase [Paenibacillus selenitireducens]|uniref:Phosphohydrolase n=1 Tax=Paenibacillus selenitireducens TaxID=1324314 RepID=A0A1T2XC24_9BACL|nr:HD domain-containing protein [Paenibacillus selenitireducens]OPA77441.1 phosphohydrolase [Paenibacillus selenitireducens]
MTSIRNMVVGDEITEFYLLKEAEVKQTRSTTPKDYFDMVLSDQSGDIPAKFWDVTPTDKETFFPRQLVKVKGIVQSYNERLQFKVEKIRVATEEDGVQLTDFIRAAPVPAEELIERIHEVTASIKDEDIRRVVAFCVGKSGDKLTHYPAAKSNHHAYFAGLAYHMNRMLEMGEFICGQRPYLNPDLVKAGIILHDIAKPEEMIAELGIVSDYSVSGKLLGHLALAYGWITEAAIHLQLSLTNEKVIALQHLVLSHHNLGEWGSPVQPQLPEAVALHYIDQLDAKLQAVEDALNTTPETEEWTKPIRVIENKPIYRLKGLQPS